MLFRQLPGWGVVRLWAIVRLASSVSSSSVSPSTCNEAWGVFPTMVSFAVPSLLNSADCRVDALLEEIERGRLSMEMIEKRAVYWQDAATNRAVSGPSNNMLRAGFRVYGSSLEVNWADEGAKRACL
jgi:hypothetical protein